MCKFDKIHSHRFSFQQQVVFLIGESVANILHLLLFIKPGYRFCCKYTTGELEASPVVKIATMTAITIVLDEIHCPFDSSFFVFSILSLDKIDFCVFGYN